MPRSVTAMLEGPAPPIAGSRARGECMASGRGVPIPSLLTIGRSVTAFGSRRLRTIRLHLCADALSLAHRSAIERQVERQHIHPRLAQEADGTPLDMLLDQLPHAIFGQIARFRNPRHLEKGRFGRN